MSLRKSSIIWPLLGLSYPLWALDVEVFRNEVVIPNRAHNRTLRYPDLSDRDLLNFAAAVERNSDFQSRYAELKELSSRIRSLRQQLREEIAKEDPKLIPQVLRKNEERIPRIFDSRSFATMDDGEKMQRSLKQSESVVFYRHSLWALGRHFNRLLEAASDVAPDLERDRKQIAKLELKQGVTRINLSMRLDQKTRSFMEYLLDFQRIFRNFAGQNQPQNEFLRNWRDFIEGNQDYYFALAEKSRFSALIFDTVQSYNLFVEMAYVSKRLHPNQKAFYNTGLYDLIAKFNKAYAAFICNSPYPESPTVQEELVAAYEQLIKGLNEEISACDSLTQEQLIQDPYWLKQACREQSCSRRVDTLFKIEAQIRRTQSHFEAEYNNLICALETFADSLNNYYGGLKINFEAVAKYFMEHRLETDAPQIK